MSHVLLFFKETNLLVLKFNLRNINLWETIYRPNDSLH